MPRWSRTEPRDFRTSASLAPISHADVVAAPMFETKPRDRRPLWMWVHELQGSASLLDERGRRGIEIDAANLRLAGQDGHVLSQRPLLHIRLEPLFDAVPHDLVGQDLAVNALIDRHDVKAVTCLHQLAQDSRRP